MAQRSILFVIFIFFLGTSSKELNDLPPPNNGSLVMRSGEEATHLWNATMAIMTEETNTALPLAKKECIATVTPRGATALGPCRVDNIAANRPRGATSGASEAY
jgi:hypothetical protein